MIDRIEPKLDTVRLEQVFSGRCEDVQGWLTSRSLYKRSDGKGLFVKATSSATGYDYCVWEGSAYQYAMDTLLSSCQLSLSGEPEIPGMDDCLVLFAGLCMDDQVPCIARRLDVAFDVPGSLSLPVFAGEVSKLLKRKRRTSVFVSSGGFERGATIQSEGRSSTLFGSKCAAEVVLYDKRAERLRASKGLVDIGPTWRVEFRFRGRFRLPGSVEKGLRLACEYQVAHNSWIRNCLREVLKDEN